MDTEITKNPEGTETWKQRTIIAPKGHVILRLIDDNVYNDEKLNPEVAGELIRSEKEVGIYEYKGEVISVGEDVSGNVAAGDYVHHARHAGTVFTFAGENLLHLPEYLICGIEKRN